MYKFICSSAKKLYIQKRSKDIELLQILFHQLGITSIFRKKNGITNSIDATLSVDSLFFHPIVSILDKMDISGMEISKEEEKK